MADAVVKLVQSRAVVSISGGELVAMLAAQAAEPFAIRAEAALAEIEDIATGSPDAPSILNKLDKDANLSDLTDFVAARANLGVRYVGGRTFYVRPDGSDTNTGLANTAGAAFQTIQKAINAAYSIDAKGAVVQVQIADGTYAEGLNIYGRPVGAFDNGDQPLRIIGNETNPENVVIRPANKDAFRIGDKATALLAGVTIGTTGSGNGIFASNHSILWHRNCRFEAVAGETIATTTYSGVYAIGPTTVVGASQSFVHATNKSIVGFSGRTLTFVGTINFATYLWGINDASVYLDSATIVGKAGGRTFVHIGGLLNVSSCTGVWTGLQAMDVTTGGLIIAEDKMALRQFYVRSDGHNNNSGFENTADGAFFSIQGAVNRLAKMPYDLMGYEAGVSPDYDWRINVQSGNFSEDVSLPDTRFSKVTIEGASAASTVAKTYTSTSSRTAWLIKSQMVGGAGTTALNALNGAELRLSNVAFTTSSFFCIADNGARIIATGPISFIGGSVQSFLLRKGGYISLSNIAVTITGTPALGLFANVQTTSVFDVKGASFSGSATGKRYDIRSNGVIEADGAATTFLPGDAAGGVSSGGQYV